MEQPKYKFGQEVKCIIETKDDKTGMTFKNEVIGKVSVIKATGTSEKDTFEYGITTDMPRCYHSGKNPFIYIIEDSIKLK